MRSVEGRGAHLSSVLRTEETSRVDLEELDDLGEKRELASALTSPVRVPPV
jgi:hypothetical protein